MTLSACSCTYYDKEKVLNFYKGMNLIPRETDKYKPQDGLKSSQAIPVKMRRRESVGTTKIKSYKQVTYPL